MVFIATTYPGYYAVMVKIIILVAIGKIAPYIEQLINYPLLSFTWIGSFNSIVVAKEYTGVTIFSTLHVHRGV